VKSLAIALALLLGCHKTSTIDCATAVTDIEHAIPAQPATAASRVLGDARHDVLGHECTKREWDQKTIGCLSSATSLLQLGLCTPNDLDINLILSNAKARARRNSISTADPAVKAEYSCVIDDSECSSAASRLSK